MFRYVRQVYLQLRLFTSDKQVLWASTADRKRTTRMIMEVVVSLVILGVCLYGLLFSTSDADTKKYLSGFLGTVIGYWLH